MTQKKSLVFVSIAVLALVLAIFIGTRQSASGATFSFSVPKVSTSSSVGVGTGSGIVTVSATTSGCVSRVLSTQGNGILITFNGVPPTPSYGHWQGASTTVAYDNGTYGCGAISAYGNGSSTVTQTTLTDSQ